MSGLIEQLVRDVESITRNVYVLKVYFVPNRVKYLEYVKVFTNESLAIDSKRKMEEELANNVSINDKLMKITIDKMIANEEIEISEISAAIDKCRSASYTTIGNRAIMGGVTNTNTVNGLYNIIASGTMNTAYQT